MRVWAACIQLSVSDRVTATARRASAKAQRRRVPQFATKPTSSDSHREPRRRACPAFHAEKGMSMALRIGLAALLLMLSQLSANAQLVKVGSTPIVLTAPQGHCGLTKEEVDITFNERMRGGAHVLAAYYDCQELAQLRSGERETAEHYAQYIAPGPPLNVEINEQSISGLCAIWREKGERIHKDVSEKKRHGTAATCRSRELQFRWCVG
jgi:hypothetical protein